MIANEIKNGNNVKLEGLGTFTPYIKKSYIGKNLNSGDIVNIPSTRCISFKPSKKLKC